MKRAFLLCMLLAVAPLAGSPRKRLACRLAELHGGTIEVDSEPGKGSTFTPRLPIQEDS